ncbi:MAG: hypothetical protein HKN72_10350 [Gemmatimonadetes bacterium]|nr:hypothetical protein [Gemmatimonadota bacterium]
MPESQFVSAAKLKPLIAYCAVAFLVVVILGGVVPAGGLRRGLVVGWLVLFPVGAWVVFKRG